MKLRSSSVRQNLLIIFWLTDTCISVPERNEINPKGRNMIRNLKVLGLALAAVFALSAVAATAASAQNGTLTSTGPVTLTATENAGQKNAFTAFGLEVQCTGSTYALHKLNSTAFIPNDSSTATITPNYKEPCVTNSGNFPTTIDMNGCDYSITLGTTTAVANQYNATFHVICSGTNQITVTVFTNATKHAENKPFCKLHIGTQSNLAGATAKDNLNGSIQLNGTVTGIAAQRTNGGEDPLLCAATQTPTAEYHINVTASGKNEAGGATNVSLSHT
jgi:hypothetical protein